jgi:uncharacterized protein YjbI with pentapeptide repeats
MSNRGTCSAPNCRHRSFAGESRCLHHLPERGAAEAAALECLRRETVLKDLRLPLLAIDGIDFSRKTLIDCDFHGASFTNCSFEGTNFTFCFFDQSVFAACRFHEAKILESVFACGRLQHTEVAVSDIIQCNFNGCQTVDSRFLACDLMYSRFLALHGEALLFEDCNLKGVHFTAPPPSWMTFTYSNKEDAIFI